MGTCDADALVVILLWRDCFCTMSNTLGVLMQAVRMGHAGREPHGPVPPALQPPRDIGRQARLVQGIASATAGLQLFGLQSLSRAKVVCLPV